MLIIHYQIVSIIIYTLNYHHQMTQAKSGLQACSHKRTCAFGAHQWQRSTPNHPYSASSSAAPSAHQLTTPNPDSAIVPIILNPASSIGSTFSASSSSPSNSNFHSGTSGRGFLGCHSMSETLNRSGSLLSIYSRSAFSPILRRDSEDYLVKEGRTNFHRVQKLLMSHDYPFVGICPVEKLFFARITAVSVRFCRHSGSVLCRIGR